MAKLWPTPAASLPQDGETPETFLARRESLREKGINGNGCGTPLSIEAQLWATPTARDGKDGYLVSTATPTNRLLGRQVLTTRPAGADGSSGSRALNPRFVEALMGWPPGWSEAHPRTPTGSSDCASSATAWCRWWRRMRSELFALGSTPMPDAGPADLFATIA